MMVTKTETKMKEAFSFNPFSIFLEWYNTQLSSGKPYFEYVSVLMKRCNDNLFILITDINGLFKEIFSKYNERFGQRIFGCKKTLL